MAELAAVPAEGNQLSPLARRIVGLAVKAALLCDEDR
jgi:hypothetical protein